MFPSPLVSAYVGECTLEEVKREMGYDCVDVEQPMLIPLCKILQLGVRTCSHIYPDPSLVMSMALETR